MTTWDFEFRGQVETVAAATLYEAKQAAQYRVDLLCPGQYTVTTTEHRHGQPSRLVATKATPKPAGKVWEYRVLVHKGRRDEIYVVETVEAHIPAAAASKAQVALDQKYGPGKYQVSVGFGKNGKPELQVGVIG